MPFRTFSVFGRRRSSRCSPASACRYGCADSGELGQSEEQINKYLVRRGLFLFGVGIAFAFFVWLPDKTFNWDILTLIGASTLILAAVRKMPPLVLAGICLLVLLASPPLRQLSDYASYWEDPRVQLRLHAERRAPGISAERLFSALAVDHLSRGWLCPGRDGFGRPPSTSWLRWRLPALGIGLLAISALVLVVRAAWHAWLGDNDRDQVLLLSGLHRVHPGDSGHQYTLLVDSVSWARSEPTRYGQRPRAYVFPAIPAALP